MDAAEDLERLIREPFEYAKGACGLDAWMPWLEYDG